MMSGWLKYFILYYRVLLYVDASDDVALALTVANFRTLLDGEEEIAPMRRRMALQEIGGGRVDQAVGEADGQRAGDHAGQMGNAGEKTARGRQRHRHRRQRHACVHPCGHAGRGRSLTWAPVQASLAKGKVRCCWSGTYRICSL